MIADADGALGEDADDAISDEPEASRGWLALIEDAEKQFADWQRRADSIDKVYASLRELASDTRDRQFQLFWANVEVLKPSIYARPPVPVVVPKFKDRRPLYRTASELLERCCVVSFDLTDIDQVLRHLRDDVAIPGRGVAWVRYETKAESDTETERVCVEYVARQDFVHEPARVWQEVGWVAKASYLTKEQMSERFERYSGEAYHDAAYEVRKDDRDRGAVDNRSRAKVWEIWSRDQNKVVWVTEGVDVVLDHGPPHLKLEGFYPCPRPAYATLQRGSLVPVPDMLFYKDQLEELNDLTARFHALCAGLQVRGFYPAGASELGDAIETAVISNDKRRMLVPISNWAAFGGTAPKDTIVWLPIDQIVATITAIVEVRKQIISDVYEIMGLSDIMRGSTDAKETATAQQLKSQYGSVRIRDKQSELVRVARDLVRICAEIMAENFSSKTLLAMSQMELPKDGDIAKQAKELDGKAKAIAEQMKQAQADPQMMQMAQANPEQAQQMIKQAEGQLQQISQETAKVKETPTVEKVTAFLKDNRIRPFVLDIETDSTIQPDEDAEKQRRIEFLTAVGGILPQLGQMIEMEPQSAPLAGELLKFATSAFRVGRQLEGVFDEFIDGMKAKAGQPKPNAEQQKAEADQKMEQQRIQADERRTQAEMQMKAQDLQMKAAIEERKMQGEQEGRMLDAQIKQRESDARLQQIQAQMQRDEQKGQLEVAKLQMEMEAKSQEIAFKRESAQIDQAVQIQGAEIQQAQAAQQASQSERDFEQRSQLNAQQAATRGLP